MHGLFTGSPDFFTFAEAAVADTVTILSASIRVRTAANTVFLLLIVGAPLILFAVFLPATQVYQNEAVHSPQKRLKTVTKPQESKVMYSANKIRCRMI
jgi:hypothetical protein